MSPSRLTDLDGVSCDELIYDGTLALARPQYPAYPLHVLALSEGTTDHHGDVRVWNVKPFVEYPRRHDRAEVAATEAIENLVALLTVDVTGQRHYQVLTRNRVRRLVVSGEDEDSGASVTLQQRSQCLTLGAREGKESPHLVPGGKGAPALGCSGGVPGEVYPGGLRGPLTELLVGSIEHRTQAGVRGALLRREIEVHGDGVETREKAPGEIADSEFKDGRSDEVGEASRGTGGARGRCRETETGSRDRHLEGLVSEATAEVVDLIDDQEVEAVSELIHVPIRALEGGHRQRCRLTDAVTVAADWLPVHGADLPRPLIEQHPGRDETQCAQLCPLHGGKCKPRLAAPGGKRDDASTVRQFPGR